MAPNSGWEGDNRVADRAEAASLVVAHPEDASPGDASQEGAPQVDGDALEASMRHLRAGVAQVSAPVDGDRVCLRAGGSLGDHHRAVAALPVGSMAAPGERRDLPGAIPPDGLGGSLDLALRVAGVLIGAADGAYAPRLARDGPGHENRQPARVPRHGNPHALQPDHADRPASPHVLAPW
ncbi:MAG: hypothetical protein AAGC79_13490 [Pseudomonadota bacterium]